MQIKEKLVEICHRVYEKEFVSAFDGNLSARREDGNIYITRSGVNKGDVTPDDILLIDPEGRKLEGEGKITTEVKIHLVAYKHRKEVNAVIHTHPVFATAFATMGEGFTTPVFPEVVLGLGKVPLCRYGTPSTDELPDSMLPHISYAWAMLLENHGAVTFGKNIEDAYFKTEKLEHTAKTIWAIRTMGREKTIPLTKLKKLYSISEEVYGIKTDERNRMDY